MKIGVIQASSQACKNKLLYRHSKGAIQIPYSGELPLELIAGIAAWCLDTGSHV